MSLDHFAESNQIQLEGTSVVLVHLGPSQPRWLGPALQGLKESGYSPILVTDREGWSDRFVGRVRVIHVQRRNVDRGDFRGGFWSLATERFLALSEAHREIQRPILHVESDVRLAPKLDFDRLGDLLRPIAFPLLSKGRGSGAVVYIREPQASATLAHSLSEFHNLTGGNDMEGLWWFWSQNQSLVSLLPCTEPADDHRLERAVGHDWAAESKKLRDLLGGLFDCASYGQFLFGTDGRNSRYGFQTFGAVNSSHFAQPEADRIVDREHWPLTLSADLRLLSVHVHSKNPRVLQDKNPQHLLPKKIGNRYRKLDARALGGNAAAAIGRRLDRLLSASS